MLVHQAREEGRRMGIHEGLSRGRDLVFQENRTLNSFAEDDSQDIEDIGEDYDLDSIDQSHSSVSDTADDDVDFQSRPPSTFEQIRPTTPPPLPIPIPRQEPIPVPPSVARSSPPRSVEIVPPVSVRGVTPSPRRPNVPIPPDNFIPHLDSDNILRMPPPFEFHRVPTPERSRSPSVTGREGDEPLMIPGPRAVSSQNRHYPRPSSPESNSTTISQFEMVNEPYLSTLRTPMSVIPEVQSDQSSPTPQLNGHRDLRHQRSSVGGSPFVLTISALTHIPRALMPAIKHILLQTLPTETGRNKPRIVDVAQTEVFLPPCKQCDLRLINVTKVACHLGVCLALTSNLQ